MVEVSLTLEVSSILDKLFFKKNSNIENHYKFIPFKVSQTNVKMGPFLSLLHIFEMGMGGLLILVHIISNYMFSSIHHQGP
jgi:hypothetical protein